METDRRGKRGERTKRLAFGDRESGLLGIGRSLPVPALNAKAVVTLPFSDSELTRHSNAIESARRQAADGWSRVGRARLGSAVSPIGLGERRLAAGPDGIRRLTSEKGCGLMRSIEPCRCDYPFRPAALDGPTSRSILSSSHHSGHASFRQARLAQRPLDPRSRISGAGGKNMVHLSDTKSRIDLEQMGGGARCFNRAPE
jgi:hypothetical protein